MKIGGSLFHTELVTVLCEAGDIDLSWVSIVNLEEKPGRIAQRSKALDRTFFLIAAVLLHLDPTLMYCLYYEISWEHFRFYSGQLCRGGLCVHVFISGVWEGVWWCGSWLWWLFRLRRPFWLSRLGKADDGFCLRRKIILWEMSILNIPITNLIPNENVIIHVSGHMLDINRITWEQ